MNSRYGIRHEKLRVALSYHTGYHPAVYGKVLDILNANPPHITDEIRGWLKNELLSEQHSVSKPNGRN